MVYVCRTEAYTEEMFKKQLSMLPAWRRDKALALARPAAQKNAVLAFSLLQYALLKEFGFSASAFTYNEHGKPYLKGNAAYFSLSHCDGAVACVVDAEEVGVDIEKVAPLREKVAARITTLKEWEALQKAENPEMAFTTLWTEKEAAAKFEGRGLSMPFQTIDKAEYLLSSHTLLPYVVTVCFGRSGDKREVPEIKTVTPNMLIKP